MMRQVRIGADVHGALIATQDYLGAMGLTAEALRQFGEPKLPRGAAPVPPVEGCEGFALVPYEVEDDLMAGADRFGVALWVLCRVVIATYIGRTDLLTDDEVHLARRIDAWERGVDEPEPIRPRAEVDRLLAEALG